MEQGQVFRALPEDFADDLRCPDNRAAFFIRFFRA